MPSPLWARQVQAVVEVEGVVAAVPEVVEGEVEVVEVEVVYHYPQ